MKTTMHHQRSAPVMDAADQPAEGHAIHNILDAVVGVIGRGRVVDGQENARDCLHHEQEQAGAAERIPPIAFRFGAIQDGLVQIVEAQTFIQPGEEFFEHGSAFHEMEQEDVFIDFEHVARKRSSGRGGGPPLTEPSSPNWAS